MNDSLDRERFLYDSILEYKRSDCFDRDLISESIRISIGHKSGNKKKYDFWNWKIFITENDRVFVI